MVHMRTALVMGGGGARGAYEAGVISYLRGELEPELGQKLQLDILCGTSVGAINACHAAAFAAEPAEQAMRLVEEWKQLELHHVLQFGVGDVFRLVRELFGQVGEEPRRHGGLVDPLALQSVVLESVRWVNIARNLRKGHLLGLAVSATEVVTGRTSIFIQNAERRLPDWNPDPHLRPVLARIGPRHALASAAIPLLFPPVRLGTRLFVDGGLRLNVPLTPALRLGADRVAVISLRYPLAEASVGREAEKVYATVPFLAGKALNALLLDQTENDLNRLRRTNAMLAAGTDAYGAAYLSVLNSALGSQGSMPLRYVRNLLIQPSQDIGKLAAEYARSSEFARRARGLAGTTVRRLAEREGVDSADLTSHLMFDGGFAERIIELGRQDARALKEQWLAFWSEEPTNEVERVQLAGRRAAS